MYAFWEGEVILFSHRIGNRRQLRSENRQPDIENIRAASITQLHREAASLKHR